MGADCILLIVAALDDWPKCARWTTCIAESSAWTC
jgi:indole-3-glycerol phosphate synthase